VSLPFGGGVFIADTSAWARSSRQDIREVWEQGLEAGQIAICPPVMIELLFSARDADSFDALEVELRELRDVPVTRSVTDAAIAAIRRLAYRRPLSHRVRLPDVLIAAAAQDVGLGVLHYDQHFDRLAEVMSFESRWIAPRGSLD
jgi:hypothetical protein